MDQNSANSALVLKYENYTWLKKLEIIIFLDTDKGVPIRIKTTKY